MSAGYVYLMRDSDGLVKIGRSTVPSARRHAVAREVGKDIELLATIATDDMDGLERAAHRHFGASRVRGEWFNLSGLDLELVRRTIATLRPVNVRLRLAAFGEALRGRPEAAAALGPMSYRRYLGGDFPGAIRWLMRYPEVGAALMKDAAAVAPETLDELDRVAEARSKKAQAARAKRERRK
jgi:hypothetical protein